MVYSKRGVAGGASHTDEIVEGLRFIETIDAGRGGNVVRARASELWAGLAWMTSDRTTNPPSTFTMLLFILHAASLQLKRIMLVSRVIQDPKARQGTFLSLVTVDHWADFCTRQILMVFVKIA